MSCLTQCRKKKPARPEQALLLGKKLIIKDEKIGKIFTE
jgi:hypothetical protein